MNQLLLENVADNVVCELPLGPWPGLPPSEVDATAYDSTGADLEITATQTVASVVLDGAITAGDLTFTVTTWGSIRVPQPGDELLVAAASDPDKAVRERTTVKSVSGLVATVVESFESGHASGSKVYPTTQRVTIAAEDTATKGRDYRVHLSVVLSGAATGDAAQTSETLFDVVAQIPRRTLTEAGIKRRSPVLFNDLSGWSQFTGGGWGAALGAAWDLVLDDVWSRGMPVDYLVAVTQLEEATYWRLCALASEEVRPAGWDAQAWSENCDAKYKAAIRQVFSRIEWADWDQDMKPTPSEQNQAVLDIDLSM